jgi:putative redox protein
MSDGGGSESSVSEQTRQQVGGQTQTAPEKQAEEQMERQTQEPAARREDVARSAQTVDEGESPRSSITSIVVDLQSGMKFTSSGEDGVSVTMDSSTDSGGTAQGFRPMELLLVGLGGCTAMDVLSILRKKRQEVTGYHVEVDGIKAHDHPYVYTAISVRHILEGNNISETAVQRAIELSETKYCSAHAMLNKAAPITSSYEIRPASGS